MKTPWYVSGRESTSAIVPSIFWNTVSSNSLSILKNFPFFISWFFLYPLLFSVPFCNLMLLLLMGLFSTCATLICIGHILLTERLLKHNIVRKIEGRGRRRRKRRKEVKEKRGYWIERGSTRSHAAGNWLCNRLWTCNVADCSMMVKGNAVYLSCTDKMYLVSHTQNFLHTTTVASFSPLLYRQCPTVTPRAHFESEPFSDKRDYSFRFPACLQGQVDISCSIGIPVIP